MVKAVVYHGPRDVRCAPVPLPDCGPDEIRVRVDACAVCGSDAKAYRLGNPRIKPPRTMGHEFTGLVEKVGENVSGFDLGRRVVMATSISCGKCFYCRRGWRNLCEDLRPMGFFYDGGMAEFVTIPVRGLRQGHVVPVPAGVPAIEAALAEPVSCCVNAAENYAIAEGDVILILGAGPMGLLNAGVARQYGAAKILLSETNPARRKTAQRFGFDWVVDPAAEDLAKIVRDETGGRGADVVLVAAPAARAQEEAVHLTRKRGTVCLFASLPSGKSTIHVDSRPIHYGELRVIGLSDSTPEHVRRAVELIASGSLPTDTIASHVLKFEDIQQAFALMESGEALRVVLTP